MELFGPPNIERLEAKKNVKGLIKALSYKKDLYVRREILLYEMSDPVGQAAAIREAAAQALGQIGDPQAVDSLITALKDEKSNIVRRAEVEALGQIGDARAVEPLIAILKVAYGDLRQAAARALGEIGDARAVEPLIAALKSKDEHVRQAAAEALVKVGAPAVETLTATLKDKDRDTCQVVVAILDKLNWQPREDEIGANYWVITKDWKRCVSLGALAVEPLIAALKEGDRDVRQAAAQALGKIGDGRAVEPLIAILKDTDGDVRQAAVEALDRLHWQPLEDEAGIYYWIFKKDWSRCVSVGSLAVKPLIAALKDKDEDVCQAAADVLSKIGAPAVDPLIAELKDKKQGVRITAAQVLGQISDERAVGPLLTAIKDEPEVLCQAQGRKYPTNEDHLNAEYLYNAVFLAIVRIDTPAVPALIDALKGKHISLRQRQYAEQALVQIGAPAVKPLVAELKSNYSDPSVRRIVAKTLGQIGDARAVESLIAALNHQNKDVRNAAAQALSDPGVRRNVAKTLGQIGDARAVESLIAALKDQNYDVRNAAAQALVEIGKPAVAPLIRRLLDQNLEIRAIAADTLDKLGWQPDQGETGAAYWIAKEQWGRCVAIGLPALEPLNAALKYDGVRLNAAYALLEIGDARAVEPLITGLKDKDELVRRKVAEALGQFGDARAVEPLITSLKDKDEFVRRVAAQALVLLYTSGNLDEKNKQTILAWRNTILGTSRPHYDRHGDNPLGCFGVHDDIPAILVEFPL